MKRQITAVITAALILANLTACCTNTEPNNNSSEISDSGNGISSPNSTDNSEPQKAELSNDIKRLIDEYPCVLEFTKRDDTVLSPSEIIRVQFPSEITATSESSSAVSDGILCHIGINSFFGVSG